MEAKQKVEDAKAKARELKGIARSEKTQEAEQRASDAEYAIGTAEYNVGTAEYNVGSAQYDLESRKSDLTNSKRDFDDNEKDRAKAMKTLDAIKTTKRFMITSVARDRYKATGAGKVWVADASQPSELRDFPVDAGSSSELLPQGASVFVLPVDSAWMFVISNGRAYWVKANTLTKLKSYSVESS